MAQVTRSTKVGGGTTLSANTLARATDVETDMLTLFAAHNNHDTGTSSWTVVSAVGSTTVPLTANNSTGTQNIAEFKDNGSTVLSVADGGNITFTGKQLGPDGTAAAPTYSFSSANNNDNGMYLDANNVVGFSAAGTKRAELSASALTMAVPIAMGTNKITGLGAGTTSGDAARYEQVGVRETPVRGSTGALTTTTSGTFADTGVTANITPSATASRVLILVSINLRLDCDATEEMVADCNVMRDGVQVTTFNRCLALKGNNNDSKQINVSFSVIDSPSTTSATTYKVQFRRNAASAAGTISVNTAAEENSHITLLEIK